MKQALNETPYLFPEVRKLADQQLSLISTKDLERNTLKFSMIDDEKVSEVEFSLEKINMPNKIQLHRWIGDVLYSNLLKATLKITRMQLVIDKLENQLHHENVENKAHSIYIKKL